MYLKWGLFGVFCSVVFLVMLGCYIIIFLIFVVSVKFFLVMFLVVWFISLMVMKV